MLGTEPIFDFATFPKTGRTWIDVVTTAKQLHHKGGRVRELDPQVLTAAQRRELDEITKEWFGTRTMAPLGFLNRVEPFSLSEHKKYFSIEVNGKTLAYVAAMPCWKRKAWYLVDVMRRKETPPGTTELLLLESMRVLKSQGALQCTLGVAPLAGLESAPLHEHPYIYKMFRAMYENGAFYTFKSLHQFKAKFEPSFGDPIYMIYSPPKLGFATIRGLFQAFQPAGFFVALGSGISRSWARFSLADGIKSLLSKDIVVRSVPPSLARLAWRCKITLALLIANLVFFFLWNSPLGNLSASAIASGVYTWPAFLQHPLRALTVPAFLHWDLWHLCTNILTLIVFGGGLEYLAGSLVMVTCFAVAASISNPVTSLLLPFGKAMGETDVGASLGIFGCAGALIRFLRNQRSAFVVLVLVSTGIVISQGNLLEFNHLVALVTGAALIRLIFSV